MVNEITGDLLEKKGVNMSQEKYDDLNTFQKLVILHAHPANFIFHLLALMWGAYFLWNHSIWLAILTSFLLSIFGQLIIKLDPSYVLLARSELNLFQKLLLYHADFRNLIFHTIGFVFFVFGIWKHSGLLLLGAISFVLLGHIFPWFRSKRQERLEALAIDEDLK